LEGRRQLEAQDDFCFGCHEKLDCFKRCCSDVNIFLTPLDVLRLARRSEMSTTDFLDRHTLTPISKDLQLPVVVLRMIDEQGTACPFLGDEGCTVYEDRPWSCRMYPVGLALPPARAGLDPEPMYFLFEDSHCDGGTQPQKWTVESWTENQGIPERERIEEGFRKLVSHPWFIGGRQLDPRRMQMFHMACYDLDGFRRFVFDSTFLERFELDQALVSQLRDDDEALLRFAFRWLRYALFAEPTMNPHKNAET